jgi:hypothetical protein
VTYRQLLAAIEEARRREFVLNDAGNGLYDERDRSAARQDAALAWARSAQRAFDEEIDWGSV